MRTSFAALAAAMLFGLNAGPAFADETDPPKDLTVSGYVQGVSDYRFRGYSLSGGDPALQGTVNLNHSSGFYAGAWASTLDDEVTPFYGDLELDLYAGWTGPLSSALTADVGVLRYVYPANHGNGPADYWEPYASLATTLGPVGAKLGVAYAPEQDSLGGEDNLYLFTDLNAGIPTTPVTVTAHLGYTDGIQGPRLLSGDSLTDQSGFDYSLGATYAVTPNLSVGASYIGVDGSASEADYRAGRSLVVANDTVVATVKLAF
jgi:uncharacterized protein (TIGR02001 family)